MLGVELDVLPQRARVPTVEIGHLEKNANFAVLLDEGFDHGNEHFIVLFGELATDRDMGDVVCGRGLDCHLKSPKTT
jgi:hypothetical protein